MEIGFANVGGRVCGIVVVSIDIECSLTESPCDQIKSKTCGLKRTDLVFGILPNGAGLANHCKKEGQDDAENRHAH